ncbi:class I adenylate-forming enzyme family protein [Actinoplanes subtropicus]|uniref:class I adenylate-forming enzyme family protein n=1 Tax=Actinoplanes subtropicus TaxID=543632 RepID=UPI00068FE03C|nr:AMP-binding protein [Actinoplanes subtropicus]
MTATVGGLMLAAARRWPDRDSLVEDDTVLSHAEAAVAARRVAARLKARGVRPGDRVALALPNGWRYAVAYGGVQLAGAVAVLVNTRFAEPEIAYVLTDCGALAVIVDAGTASRVPPVCPLWDVEELTAPGDAADELPGLSVAGSDVANILYTSGTTGQPKGAMQTHANIAFNTGTCGTVLGATAGDRTLVIAPMFHATGIVSQLVGFGAHGAARVFQPRFTAAGMREALIEHRITVFAGVTAMIHLMLADPAFDPAELPHLRMVCFGGSPVPEAFLAGATARLPGVTFANIWGLTEATSIVTCAIGREWQERPWSVGRPVPGLEVRVAEPDPDGVGELWVRGPAVTAGYWGRPEATAETFRADGWLRTGDIGQVDASGYVRVLDRLKDMIIRGGENIYSLEVEGALARHPAVADVAVVGVADEVMGERVRAVVVLRPGRTLALDELRAWAADRLADYKLPVELVRLDELPRNPSGKILKRRLAEIQPAGGRP